jgi:hypothetical protein
VARLLERFGGHLDDPIERTVWGQVERVTPRWLIMHPITHEFSHKGQIVVMVRLLGVEPFDTDRVRPFAIPAPSAPQRSARPLAAAHQLPHLAHAIHADALAVEGDDVVRGSAEDAGAARLVGEITIHGRCGFPNLRLPQPVAKPPEDVHRTTGHAQTPPRRTRRHCGVRPRPRYRATVQSATPAHRIGARGHTIRGTLCAGVPHSWQTEGAEEASRFG